MFTAKKSTSTTPMPLSTEDSRSVPLAIFTEENEVDETAKLESTKRPERCEESWKKEEEMPKLITHSFHTKASEVRSMEHTLMQLLDDFNSGRLRAFGQGCSMRGMEELREQQERLARLHLEIGGRDDAFAAPLSDSGLNASKENMNQLMQRLETLSDAIESLNPSDNSSNVDKEKEKVERKKSSLFNLGADEDHEDQGPPLPPQHPHEPPHTHQHVDRPDGEQGGREDCGQMKSLDSEETLVGHSNHSN